MYRCLEGFNLLGSRSIVLCIIRVSLLPELESYALKRRVDVQLKKRKVSVAVVGLLFALVLDVVLKDGGGLWVVSVQAVEDGLDVLWALWRVVEGDTHGYDLRGFEEEVKKLDVELR